MGRVSIRIRALALGFSACLGSAHAGPSFAQEARIGIERGAVPAPVTLTDVRGGEVDLGRYFGQEPVLLEFWATWCEKCEALHPRMVEAHGRYGDRVRFFAIAVAVGQSERRVRGHLDRHPIPFPVLWDGRGEAVRTFEAPATSYVVVLDAAGVVAYTGIGGNQDIDAAIRSVLDSGPGD